MKKLLCKIFGHKPVWYAWEFRTSCDFGSPENRNLLRNIHKYNDPVYLHQEEKYKCPRCETWLNRSTL